MGAQPHLRWDPYEYDPDYEPDIRERDEEGPRDPVVDQAKDALREFFNRERGNVFYKQQLEVIFEREFFHWVTSRALSELAAEDAIAEETEELAGIGVIKLYHATPHRYWRRQGQDLIGLVARFSAPAFTSGLGAQGELMFDAALPTVGFLPSARKVKAYQGKEWTETEHDLDRVFERDGISYGTEIKNTLKYIPRDELTVKIRMCQQLALRPLFIVRQRQRATSTRCVCRAGSLWFSSTNYTLLCRRRSLIRCVRV